MKILIAISCHSWPQYTDEAIASALTQKFFTDKIDVSVLAVVDHGGPVEHYKKRADEQKTILWHFIDDTGVTYSRNAAFQFAVDGGYDFVVPLDEDDVLKPMYIRRATDYQRLAQTDVIYTNYEVYSTGRVIAWGRFSSERLRQGPFIPSCSLIDTEVWEAVRGRNGHGYDPGLEYLGWEDYLFWLEADALGAGFSWLPLPLFRCRWHGGSRTEMANEQVDEIRAYIKDKMECLPTLV